MSLPHEDRREGCKFCVIAHNEDPRTQLLYEDENFAAFRDIRPASAHHFLIVPKRHVDSARVLQADDAELVERLVAVGREVLAKHGVGPSEDDQVRMGFHWPPFTRIKHLHLHVIHPVSGLTFLGRTIYRPNSWWFVSPGWVVKRLEKKSREEI